MTIMDSGINPVSRRSFLKQTAAAVSAGFVGLKAFDQAYAAGGVAGGVTGGMNGGSGFGYGPLVADPRGVLDLPAGFTYRVISQVGREMDDGLLTPGRHDGMGAFDGPDGKTIIICNHEVVQGMPYTRHGAFGFNLERIDKVPTGKFYDYGNGILPGLGGTTTIVYDTKTGKVEKNFMSLIGTERNCAGGVTPWNTWITCEETVAKVNEAENITKDHGYCFEVPATAEIGAVDPSPIVEMGRMNHEAISVDPWSGIVYLTEDRHEGCIYRYIPNVPGKMLRGGRLQALAIKDRRPCDTRNWLEATRSGGPATNTWRDTGEQAMSDEAFPMNTPLDVDWIDVQNVTAPDDDLRFQMWSKGAARFARGEGMWYGRNSIFFACTNGGLNKKGQLFRYVPSRFEGKKEEAMYPGQLELFVEPNDHDLMENADNITVAPWGDLIVAEDAKDNNDLIGVTPEGQFYKFAANVLSSSEFAGCCFSPDGTTLFANIQGNGITLAITGPWRG